MDPGRVALDKALQKARREDVIHAAFARALLDIGDLAGQQGVKILVKREGPDPFAAILAGLDQPGPPALFVGEHAAVGRAQSMDAGPGQGGKIHDQGRLFARGQRQGVGQDHAALGVGMHHLDRAAVGGRDHIIRLVGVGADMVHGQRQPAFHGPPEVQLTERQQGAERDRAALHVFVHAEHIIGRFQVGAARVITNPLADQTQRFAGGLWRRITQAHNARVPLRAALSNREEGPGLFLFQGRLVIKFELPVIFRGNRPQPLEVFRGGQAVRRQRAQITAQRVAPGHGEALLEPMPGGHAIEDNLLEPGRCGRLAFEARQRGRACQGRADQRLGEALGLALAGRRHDQPEFGRVQAGLIGHEFAGQGQQFKGAGVGFKHGKGDMARGRVGQVQAQDPVGRLFKAGLCPPPEQRLGIGERALFQRSGKDHEPVAALVDVPLLGQGLFLLQFDVHRLADPRLRLL